jgi:hypothetical protein
MGLALIWVETLTAALVLLALFTACTVRLRWRLDRVGLAVLAALLLTAATGAAAYVLVTFWAGYYATYSDMFWYSHSFVVALVVGTVVLLARGLWPRAEPAARSWSRPRLTLALLALLTIDFITVSNIDLAVQVQMAAVRTEASARALDLVGPRPPDSDNAAPAYVHALEVFEPGLRDAPEGLRDAWFDRSPNWPRNGKVDSKAREVRMFLDRQRPSLQLFRKAAAMPNCRFDYAESRGVNMHFGERKPVHFGSDLLSLSALTQAADGNGRGALADIALCFRMARHVNDMKDLGLGDSFWIELDTAATLEAVLALGAPPAEDLTRLQIEPGRDARRDAQRLLTIWEAALEGSFDDVSRLVGLRMLHSDTPAVRLVFESVPYRVFFLRDDLSEFQQNMRRLKALAAKPYYQCRGELAEFYQQFRANRHGVMTRLVTPGVVSLAELAARAEATRGLIRLAIAMTVFRAKTGKYPDTLDAMLPQYILEIPMDPCDGKPLRMKRDGNGIVLYSVGIDQTDDGGRDWDAGSKTGDITFRLR